jgi:hypothetical protein
LRTGDGEQGQREGSGSISSISLPKCIGNSRQPMHDRGTMVIIMVPVVRVAILSPVMEIMDQINRSTGRLKMFGRVLGNLLALCFKREE